MLDKIIEAEFFYDDFLTTGFFGTQINKVLLQNGELKWWGILLIIFLGFIAVVIFTADGSAGTDICVRCRNLVAFFLFFAIIPGTTGVLFIGVVESWAILEIIVGFGTKIK